MNSQANNKKKFHIHTLGCKVNQYESQVMRELLIGAGFEEAASRNNSDIYIVNTCTVTKEADRESRYLIGVFDRTNPKAKIVVTGCYVEKDAEEVASLRGVSHIVKNSEKNRIVDILRNPLTPYPLTLNPNQVHNASITGFKDHSKAYVKIQDGCENRCSYCKVPLVRKTLESKPVSQIIEEVDGLAQNGFKEIILTGICLGAWSGISSKANLLDVLKALDAMGGDFRIRLSSIEPKYVTSELIEFIAANERICPHLHMPFQSGDDDILKLMNRPYTSLGYRQIVEKIRARIPRIAITTDILIGFPGESTERFENTVGFVRAIAPSRTHIFTFSKREGTPAYDMPNTITPLTLKKRYNEMNAAAIEMSNIYKKGFLGEELDVLVETKRDKAKGLLKGYSGNYLHVLFEGPDELMRKIVRVKVTSFDPRIGILGLKSGDERDCSLEGREPRTLVRGGSTKENTIGIYGPR